MMQKLIASLHEFGFVDPVTVREFDVYYQIIDGEHRWQAALEHGRCEGDEHHGLSRVPIFDLGPVSDSVAKQLTIVLNETRGQPDPKKLGELLRDLMARESKERLLATLPYTREAFDGLVGLPSFSWDDIARPPMRPAAERPAAWVEKVYRMPPDAAAVIDEAISRYRAESNDKTPEWRVLELLAADYLGS